MPNDCKQLEYRLTADKDTNVTPGVGAYLKSTFGDTLNELGIKDDFREGLKWKNDANISDLTRSKFRLLWLAILNKKFIYEIVYTGIMNYVIMNSPSSGNAELQQQQKYAAEIAMYVKSYYKRKNIFSYVHRLCFVEQDNGVIMKKIHGITKYAIVKAIEEINSVNTDFTISVAAAAAGDACDKLDKWKPGVKTQSKPDEKSASTLSEVQENVKQGTIKSEDFRKILLPSDDMPKLALIHWARLVTEKKISFQLPRPSQISDGAKPLLFVAINNVVEIVDIPLSSLVQITVGGSKDSSTPSNLVVEIKRALERELMSMAENKYSIKLTRNPKDSSGWSIQADSNAIQGDNTGSQNRLQLYKDYCAWLNNATSNTCIWSDAAAEAKTAKKPRHNLSPCLSKDKWVTQAMGSAWLKYFGERGYFSSSLTLNSQCESRYNSFKQEIVEAGVCNWEKVDDLCKGIDKHICIMRGSRHVPKLNPLDVEHLQEYSQFGALKVFYYQYVLAMMCRNLNVGALTSNKVIDELFKYFGHTNDKNDKNKTGLNIDPNFNIVYNEMVTRSFMGRLYLQCILDTDNAKMTDNIQDDEVMRFIYMYHAYCNAEKGVKTSTEIFDFDDKINVAKGLLQDSTLSCFRKMMGEEEGHENTDLESILKEIIDMIMITDQCIMTEDEFNDKWIDNPTDEKNKKNVQIILSSIQEYQNMLTEQGNLIADLQSKCNELKTELTKETERLNKKINELEEKLKMETARADAEKARADATKKELEELRAKVVEMQRKKEEMDNAQAKAVMHQVGTSIPVNNPMFGSIGGKKIRKFRGGDGREAKRMKKQFVGDVTDFVGKRNASEVFNECEDMLKILHAFTPPIETIKNDITSKEKEAEKLNEKIKDLEAWRDAEPSAASLEDLNASLKTLADERYLANIKFMYNTAHLLKSITLYVQPSFEELVLFDWIYRWSVRAVDGEIPEISITPEKIKEIKYDTLVKLVELYNLIPEHCKAMEEEIKTIRPHDAAMWLNEADSNLYGYIVGLHNVLNKLRKGVPQPDVPQPDVSPPDVSREDIISAFKKVYESLTENVERNSINKTANITDILRDILEAGVDGVKPLQHNGNMDPKDVPTLFNSPSLVKSIVKDYPSQSLFMLTRLQNNKWSSIFSRDKTERTISDFVYTDKIAVTHAETAEDNETGHDTMMTEEDRMTTGEGNKTGQDTMMTGGQMKKWVGGNGMEEDDDNEDDDAAMAPPLTLPEAAAADTWAGTEASSFEQSLITLFKNSTGVNLNTDMVGQVVQTAIEEAQKKTKEMMQTGGGPVLNSGTGDVEMSISESSGGGAVQPEGVGDAEDKFDEHELEKQYQLFRRQQQQQPQPMQQQPMQQQYWLQQQQQSHMQQPPFQFHQQQQPLLQETRGTKRRIEGGGKKTRRKHKRIHKKSRRKPRKSVSPGRWLRKPKRYSRNKRFKLRKRNTQNRKTKKRKTTRRKKKN